MAEAGLTARSVVVSKQVMCHDVPGWSEQAVKFSYLERDGAMRVLNPTEPFEPGDRVLAVGNPDDVAMAVDFLGHDSERTLTHDRREVDFRRFLVSNPSLVGRSIAELNVSGRLHGIVTRVRRGDIDMLARDDLNEWPVPGAPKDEVRLVSNIVLMGSGEPLDNYDNVCRFLRLLREEDGVNIGLRNVSLSTCGLVPKMYQFAEENLPVTLSVSLHAPNDEIRRQTMPVANAYPMDELLAACRNYPAYHCDGG